MLLMDRETDSLNRVRDLIHMQQEAIDNYMEWEDNVESHDHLFRMTSESFIRVFSIMKIFSWI